MGIQDPVIDQLVKDIIATPDRRALVANARALDRILLWGHYVIPHWHIKNFRVAYWNKFEKPDISPKYDLGIDFWWINSEKEGNLKKELMRGQSKANNSEENGQLNGWVLFALLMTVIGFVLIRKQKRM